MADPVNLSREFRTLVAAIRGPLDEELADRTASAARRDRIKLLHRNFMRLLQVVNALFDLPQTEARHAGCELVDSSATTLVIPIVCDGTPAADYDPAGSVDED